MQMGNLVAAYQGNTPLTVTAGQQTREKVVRATSDRDLAGAAPVGEGCYVRPFRYSLCLNWGAPRMPLARQQKRPSARPRPRRCRR
jgi:hypothetical protein